MNKSNYASFTSESVSAGHPDKVCDQISDAFLDKALAVDADARVACEALVKTIEVNGKQKTQLVIAGEISPQSALQQCEADRDEIVRETIARAGYDDPAFGVDVNALDVHWLVSKQSEDIAGGVDGRADDEEHRLGAGDQGMMFGFACDETDSYMPSPIDYAHRLMRQHAALRQEKAMPELGPDAKAQVTVDYSGGQKRIDVVVLSTQHTADIATPKQMDELREQVKERIIFAALPQHLLTKDTVYHIKPAGAFIQGEPAADCGLTGRKIIVDTYGGYARHGGGAFSGKDSSKVDRSAAYAARYIAKNLVAAKLVSRCEVQLSYAIGYDKPVSVAINTDGAATAPEEKIRQVVDECFDLSPQGIIEMLNLKRPIYLPTAAYGHFGRDEYRGKEGLFPWEKCDKIEAILARL